MEKTIKKSDMEKLAEYRKYLYIHPRLTYLFFELTDACNLCCLHCGSNAGPKNKIYLSHNAVKTVMDQVVAAFSPQSIMICFSGGEPLLHPQFFEMVAYAKKLGFACGMTTNGTLIDLAVAKKIVESGLDSVTFSLDGLKDMHDWFRNKAGAFERTVQGIHNLLDVSKGKIVTQITTVIHRKNIHQLPQMLELISRVGIDSWRIVNLEPIGRALENKDLLLNAEEFRQMLCFIREKRYSSRTKIDVTYGCSHYLMEDYERTVRDNYFICGAGIFVASVLCNGDIYACMDIERKPELIQGNIFIDNFVDVWQKRFQIYRSDRSGKCEMCRRCNEKEFCCGDSAHTWDYILNRPLLCIKQLFERDGSKR